MVSQQSFYMCNECGSEFSTPMECSAHERSVHVALYRKSGLLTDDQAARIRERIPFGPPNMPLVRQLADEWGINPMTVFNIATGLSYRRPKACPPGHPLRLALNERNAAKQRIRDKVKPSMRKEIGDRQEWRCVYCSADISKRSSIDHIVPIEHGGESTMENLQLTCLRCNLSKNVLSDSDYRVKLNRIEQALYRREGQARQWGFSSYMAEQQFFDCPCHHYGCPPGCPSCEMCDHEPGFPTNLVCPMGETGLERCTDNGCRTSCKGIVISDSEERHLESEQTQTTLCLSTSKA